MAAPQFVADSGHVASVRGEYRRGALPRCNRPSLSTSSSRAAGLRRRELDGPWTFATEQSPGRFRPHPGRPVRAASCWCRSRARRRRRRPCSKRKSRSRPRSLATTAKLEVVYSGRASSSRRLQARRCTLRSNTSFNVIRLARLISPVTRAHGLRRPDAGGPLDPGGFRSGRDLHDSTLQPALSRHVRSDLRVTHRTPSPMGTRPATP